MTAGPAREPVRHTDESAGPTATLAEVDIRSELSTRPPRLPDSEGLDRALAVLAREMTENPRSMLQKLVETAQAQIGRRGQTLSVELPGAPMWLMGDAVRLAQLLSNLLDNAAKYTPAGGQIWVSARSTEAFPRTSWATSLICSPSWTPRPAALDWDWRWCGTWRRGMEGASRLRARGPAWAASSRYDCRAYRLRPRPRRRRFSRRRGYRILDAS